VLVEDAGFGRSRENWTVHFRGDGAVGDLVRVRVESASLVTLRGVQSGFLATAPASGKRRLAVVHA
jgi:hypothetical protein